MTDVLDSIATTAIGSLPGFKLLSVCGSALVCKAIALAFYTGMTRAKHRLVMNPEDSDKAESLMETPPPAVARVMRAHRNDIENVPLFLLLALLTVLAGAQPLVLTITITTFTVARFAHSFFYLNAMQPWRSVSHGIGVLSTFVVIGALLMKLFI